MKQFGFFDVEDRLARLPIDEFGFVEPVNGFRQSVIIGISNASD